ncbi:hypothetical protein HY463_00975, partial [Candidatus Peregrinibacteria bacterium]|nr:hypothetical protein [Candidatus Peregrinibacteria bacterium]
LEETNAGILKRLDGLEETNAGILKRLDGFEETNAGILKRLDGLEETNAGILKRLDRLEASNKSIIDAVSFLQSDVSDIKENYATKADLRAVTATLEDLAGSLQAIEESSASFYQWQMRQDAEIGEIKTLIGKS